MPRNLDASAPEPWKFLFVAAGLLMAGLRSDLNRRTTVIDHLKSSFSEIFAGVAKRQHHLRRRRQSSVNHLDSACEV
jgi:hypothetical protein